MKIIIDVLRLFIWGIVYAVMKLMDMAYSITMDVASINIANFGFLWEWWTLLIALIGLIVFIRIITMTIKFFTDTEGDYNISVVSVLYRTILVLIVMGITPFMVNIATNTSQTLIQNVNLITGSDAETVPSTLIISSIHNAVYTSEDGNEIAQEYRIEDISINTQENGDYVFFAEMGDLFLLLIIGGVGSVGFLLNALQMAQRLFSLGAKILVSPLPIASLVDKDSEQFSLWVKMCMSDLLSNFMQILILYLVMFISASQEVRLMGPWVTVIMLCGGVMALLSGAPELAKLIGGDTSTSSVIQQFASIRQATNGIGGSAKKIAKSVSGSAYHIGKGVGGSVGSNAVYHLGRSIGGKSISTLKSEQTESGFNNAQTSNNESLVQTGSRESQTSNEYSSQQATSSASTSRNQPGINRTSLARDNSFASRFAQSASGKTGLSGKAARFASVGSAHLYTSAINRKQRSLPHLARTNAKNFMTTIPNINFKGKGES